MREKFLSTFRERAESLFGSKPLDFGATILGIGEKAPTNISGTVYFPRDFVDMESIERINSDLEKGKFGSKYWDNEKFLGFDTWRMEKDKYIAPVLALKNKNEGIPDDIILVVSAGFDPNNIPRIAPSVRALFTKVGILSHMAIVTREYFQHHLQDNMEGLIVLTDVPTRKLKSGDKAEINILPDRGSAEVKVTRPPKT